MAQRLYHFTRADYALDDIRRKRLKIAQFDDLNDPYELNCVELTNQSDERAFAMFKAEMSPRNGILCFSEHWNKILQWSNYADRHRGICLGFDVSSLASKFGRVEYIHRKLPFLRKDQLNSVFMWKMLRTKYYGWEYEKEWRVFVELKEPEWNQAAKRDYYFANFAGELALREVILGADSKTAGDEVRAALEGDAKNVEVFRVYLSPDSFKLLRKPERPQ